MTDIEQAIKSLRDDSNYYGEYGAQFMSNTDVKSLVDDPSLFKQGITDSENLVKGRLAHVLLFEPHKVHEFKVSGASRRGTKEYWADQEKYGEDWLMLKKDFDDVAIAVKAFKSNPEIYSMMFHPDAKFEEPNIFEYMGFWWKTKADSETPDIVYDFKTTGDLSRFKWAAKEYGYDSQAYLYQKSYQKQVVFIVGEKGTGKLGVFPCSDSFLESGYEKVKLAVSNYKKYWDPSTKVSEPEHYFIQNTL